MVSDPMTWRDLAWLLWAITVGWVISLVVVVLMLAVATLFFWWFGTPQLMALRSRVDLFFLTYGATERLEQRVAALTRSRAEAVDHSAAELRRLERDLHDGTQARLVAVSMSLGMAEAQFDSDPSTPGAPSTRRARRRARRSPTCARWCAASTRRCWPTAASTARSGRWPSTWRCRSRSTGNLTAGRRCRSSPRSTSRSPSAWPTPPSTPATSTPGWSSPRRQVLRVVVGDDGRGGADVDEGTGMRGVMRRLAAFDGTMSVSSPDGGPTVVTLEVPCVLSSQRTTPSSASA